MKGKILLGCFCLVFLMAYEQGEQTRPVAVSPGSESGLVIVGHGCPTFSWSAVSWSEAYKVAVFPAIGAEVLTYEEMEPLASPIVSKEILGLALSWTPSEAERLASGEAYVWYVQAVDTSGVGVWSEGRMFQVEESIRLVGVKEKLRESLKEYGMRDEDIERVVAKATSGQQGVTIQDSSLLSSGYNMGVDRGLEGTTNTYYGHLAGANATGSYNSFFGRSAGYQTTGVENTFVGYFVGRYNQSGNYNTFMGRGAGKWNFTGSYNTYIGAYAGHNTTSSYNTMFGSYAGYSNTTGAYNTFLGTSAGYNNTAGNYNTFIGYDAGFSTTTGGYNTFIGDNTGRSNTTSSYNTFIGYDAGTKTTTGGLNAFLGYIAGQSNTTGYENTFLGSYAGYGNTTGNYNTFIGTYAGYGNTTGLYNTFLGNYAGRNNNTAGSNTFLGYCAGYNNSSGNYNVFLGYLAGYSETGSNKLYIDNSSTSTPLLWGDFDTQRVRIYQDSGTWVEFYPGSSKYINIYNGGDLAYCSGTQWVDSSSREVKENIVSLDAEEAREAFEKLEPVKFNYKEDKEENSVGFIAEDVPDLVAIKDRKGMVAMDVVAVLTKVVQEQQEALSEQKNKDELLTQIVQKQQETIDELRKEINDLKKRK